jgi:N-terminal half of MaoC dehydratase/MaoC like domain
MQIEIGDEVPAFARTTEFAHWNRYAAVNDEFIDVHMSTDAAKAAGQPDVFGMGNLRVAYVHNALHDWLGPEGDITAFACQFRALNFLGDRLVAHAKVTALGEAAGGARCVTVDFGVLNQSGEETMPGTAELVVFGPDGPSIPPAPESAEPVRREPGVYLDAATISWLGRSTDPVASLPVDCNDIRRWAMAVYYPDPPPADFFDLEVADAGPWGGMVAPRDFNPFAWVREFHPESYPWMRGMGTEEGSRGLNGGQRSLYFNPIRPGDVISCSASLADAYEKDGRLGTMLFLIDETRWTNQRDELVKIGFRTTIYH